MCGICGFINLESIFPLEEREQVLQKMCRTLTHRGPDDSGTYFSEVGFSFAATRLSILDLVTGHQPISNEDKSCWVVLNGEIYNYPALRKELISCGHDFSTQCDTEAIVHAYEQWGTDCVAHLDGMFAFALWDEKRHLLMLSRDRLGKKPLYYSISKHAFIFGSEIKALLSHPSCSTGLDFQALDMFLTLGYIPGPHTIFEGIKKLQPGNNLIFDHSKQISIIPYWELPYPNRDQNNDYPENLALQTLESLLEEAVQKRLLADVPIGVLLSGGLDSSLLTALVKRVKPDQLKSFSVSFREANYNEAKFAKSVSQFLGTEHSELPLYHCSPDLLRMLIWHCDEPLADPAIVPTYLVSKLAREQVKVVLTGEGADELFAGYFYHSLEKNASRLDPIPGWARQNLLIPFGKTINWMTQRQRFHPRTLWSWKLNSPERSLAWMAIFTDEDKKRFFGSRCNSFLQHHYAEKIFRLENRKKARGDWLLDLLYLDLTIPLVDDLLMKVDKMSMAASLEARCPYLDYRLVEFSVGLPERMKLSNGTNKVLLRRLSEKYLPREITTRKKHGFDVPIHRWLTEDLHDLFWDTISSTTFSQLGIISEPQVRNLWDEMELGVLGSDRQVWSLLILANWFNIFLGSKVTP